MTSQQCGASNLCRTTIRHHITGQALPPGQQLMIVNAQGQLQPLTPEQLATVRMQQAMLQQQQQQQQQPQQQQLQQQIIQSGGGQEIVQTSFQMGGQTYSQSAMGNLISSDMMDQQQTNAITTMQVSSAQTVSAMQMQQQQQIQLLQTSQSTSAASQIQQTSLPQQQIVQTVNGQQVLIQAPQVNFIYGIEVFLDWIGFSVFYCQHHQMVKQYSNIITI